MNFMEFAFIELLQFHSLSIVQSLAETTTVDD